MMVDVEMFLKISAFRKISRRRKGVKEKLGNK